LPFVQAPSKGIQDTKAFNTGLAISTSWTASMDSFRVTDELSNLGLTLKLVLPDLIFKFRKHIIGKTFSIIDPSVVSNELLTSYSWVL
jgi:hypothetical protein